MLNSRKKHLFLSLIFVLLFISTKISFAQSKKDIRKNGVKGMTEVIVEYENGKEVSHNDVSKKFDKEGEIILEVNYDKNGALKDKTATKFNRDGDKIEETIFDATGKQANRFVYKYNADGEKSEEIKYDSKNTLVSRSVYVINGKGLKTERKTYDVKGKLIQTKKYIYEYPTKGE